MTLINAIIFVIIIAYAVFLFRRHLMEYEYIFFSGKALQLALLKTGLMIGLLVLLFYGADWLLGLWLSPGYLRSALAYLIPSWLFDQLSELLSWTFDRAIGVYRG